MVAADGLVARRTLSDAQLAVAQAVAGALSDAVGPVVVGVSGGADSLALAAGSVWAAVRLPVVPVAVVVDHGLQAGSAEVALRAAEQCRSLGLPAVVERVLVEMTCDGPEADARRARLSALEAYPGPVLLGHTRDDQAETVLLGLLRGSGTRSLAGMAPVNGRLVRPLLGLRRRVVARACADWGLEPWSDPMNADEHFARVRARGLMVALTAALGEGVVENLARTAALCRSDADALDSWAAAALAQGSDELAVAGLGELPDAVRTRVIRQWLVAQGARDVTSVHVSAVDALITDWHGQGRVDVPGLGVTRADERLVARSFADRSQPG